MLTRFLRTFILILVLLIVVGSFLFISPRSRTYLDPFTEKFSELGGFDTHLPKSGVDGAALNGQVIMPKLGNETVK
jgi:FAD-linked sulfhydryl oxidase